MHGRTKQMRNPSVLGMRLCFYRKKDNTMFKAFLIKYAEIGVKGKNRHLFEEALAQQIKYALKRCEGEFEVRRTRGRIYIDVLSGFNCFTGFRLVFCFSLR